MHITIHRQHQHAREHNYVVLYSVLNAELRQFRQDGSHK